MKTTLRSHKRVQLTRTQARRENVMDPGRLKKGFTDEVIMDLQTDKLENNSPWKRNVLNSLQNMMLWLGNIKHK